MFFKTYKTTLKRIFRSPLFWMALAVVVVLVFMDANQEHISGVNYGDKDPQFILTYNKYHQTIANLMRKMMLYIIPCLCVVTVMTVAGGDYSDNFYEIERAGGVRSTTYFFGRLSAIITVLFVITLLLSLFSVNYYFFTRGGVSNFSAYSSKDYLEDWPLKTLGDYILDSTKVVARLVLLCQLPVVILFTSVTYMIGAYLESGILAGIGGSICTVIVYLVTLRYQWEFLSVIYKYLLPAKIGPYLYLSRYDTVFASDKYTVAGGGNPFLHDTLEDVITWIAVMLAISLVCIAISYVCTRRRKI